MRIISMLKKQIVMLGNMFVSKTGKSEPRKGHHGTVMIHIIIKALSSTRLDIKPYTLIDMVAEVSKVSQKLPTSIHGFKYWTTYRLANPWDASTNRHDVLHPAMYKRNNHGNIVSVKHQPAK